jgi:hypothetical protein
MCVRREDRASQGRDDADEADAYHHERHKNLHERFAALVGQPLHR